MVEDLIIKGTKTKGYRVHFPNNRLATDNSFYSKEEAVNWLETHEVNRAEPERYRIQQEVVVEKEANHKMNLIWIIMIASFTTALIAYHNIFIGFFIISLPILAYIGFKKVLGVKGG
jgi:hypothetical protein